MGVGCDSVVTLRRVRAFGSASWLVGLSGIGVAIPTGQCQSTGRARWIAQRIALHTSTMSRLFPLLARLKWVASPARGDPLVLRIARWFFGRHDADGPVGLQDAEPDLI
jgi:hypothetical protein